MKSRRRLVTTAFAMPALIAGLFVGSTSAGASPEARTYVIGVDGLGPSGHNFEYVDYFPRGQVLPTDPPAVVGNGAILHFTYGLAPDGLHTAALVPLNQTPQQVWAANPGVVLDADDPSPHLIFNPDVLFASPTGCGQSESAPCLYTGQSLVNSGAMPLFASADFFVQIRLASATPTTVNYVCLIHPGMRGSIKVVPGRGSSPTAFADAAAAQLAADTSDALAAESQANITLVTPNGDGTSTITMTAGTATQFVEVAEMLPRNVSIQAGNKVKWVTKTIKDVHTVTFPEGSGSDSVDPFTPPFAPPPECEGAPDTPPPCSPGSALEFGVNPAPNGVTVITSSSTVATSGIIASFPPFGNNYIFSFPNAGSFAYQCRIHDHMVGTIEASS